MMDLEHSYAEAERISRSSGSSFYRSFQFLRSDRRRAMHALYAFARLADDATDGMESSRSGIPDARETQSWNSASWLRWLHLIGGLDQASEPTLEHLLPSELESIRVAFADSVVRYRIPLNMLESLILGMEMDARGCEILTWEELRQYAFRVASSIGICCTAVWTDGDPIEPGQPLWHAAVDCGVAFQLTNILRDIKEDASRGRVYLPLEDLERFGISRTHWMETLLGDASSQAAPTDSISKLLEVQLERARGLFARGWQLHRMLDADSFRMFSLMWHTYREILARIEAEPLRILRERVRLGTPRKLKLAANHFFTPLLIRITRKIDRETRWLEHAAAPKLLERQPQVAVVGGGLAGMNAAFHLSRHGCDTVLFEAKSRLGGRAGSFSDPATGQAIDYCQHVGMKCCTELLRWIAWTGASDSWRVMDTLHFVSNSGKRLAVRAWPLPAPLHLCGLILGWPDLSFIDRLRVVAGLSRLITVRSTPDFERMPALQWLKTHFQNQRTIDRFWGTILVSALGEQVDRVAMGPVKKVLVDGFAATRDAFHLLVPTQPLSKLVDDAARSSLVTASVDVRCGTTVRDLVPTSSGRWAIDGDPNREFDAVVMTVPWHRMGSLLQQANLSDQAHRIVQTVDHLEASPITGVHTWWDQPWLHQPHAILVDRLCQWVFPGPHSQNSIGVAGETYYQVVISGSRQLPRGDQQAVLQSVQQDLKDLFPEAAQAQMLRGKVVTDPQSVFSVAPGHASSRLSCDALADVGLFLGGDWINTGWPATMEGALRSGSLAAECTLAYLGRPAKWLP